VNTLPSSPRTSDAGIRALFTRESRWQAWLDVEAALATAEADLGLIPREAAEEIARKARIELLDIPRVEEMFRVAGHALVPLIWELDRICEGDAGGFVHWGATTQNITQTGDLLLLRRVHAIFLSQLAALLATMAGLAERTSTMAMPGRTHGQHAVPITFGLKVASWIDEMCRHVERLRGCEPRIFVAMLGGAAGSFASFGPKGLDLQSRYAEYLGLRPMPVPYRSTLDHEAEYVTILALLASTGGRIAKDVFHLTQQEFGEAAEPHSPGAVGSSTMPQKRNPRLSQQVIVAEAKVRALVPLAIEAMQQEHEAVAAGANMMSHALHESCALTGDILQTLNTLIAGLEIFPERMRANLDLSGGLIMAESVMLELGAKIGRQRAHDAVYEAAQEAIDHGRPFLETLAERPEITERVSQEELRALLDPVRYVGLSPEVAATQARRARELSADLAQTSWPAGGP